MFFLLRKNLVSPCHFDLHFFMSEIEQLYHIFKSVLPHSPRPKQWGKDLAIEILGPKVGVVGKEG